MIELNKCRTDLEIYTATLHGTVSYTSVYTPVDYDDAVTCEDKGYWILSIKDENDSIKENKVYTKMKLKDLPREEQTSYLPNGCSR